ncbi:MAG TPA: Na+/H+ antiporter NhaC family protein [Anaerovoracaceae bacterium]|nr:Na+/H+ antiporter NhaC family protein [Anaerovoracaceae bacterium]
MNPKYEGYSKIIKTYGIVVIFFIAVVLLSPKNVDDFGPMSAIPAAFLLVYIFYTKRILESLMLGGLLGFLMGLKADFFSPLSDSFLDIMIDEDIGWLFIVCGLMGSIIALIEKAGGAYAFGEWVSKRAKTRKSTLMWTWVLGAAIFIDDYLNCLTVGASMSPLTDRHKVPREFLAYVVDSTAAPVCVLVPISTWAIFIGSLMEQHGMAPSGQGVAYFIRTIPFNFYGWFAALIVPLIIMGIIPIYGPMRGAFRRAEETGVLAPPGSEKIDMKAGEIVEVPENAKLATFFLPIIVLVLATIIFDVDMQKGVITTCAFIFIYYVGTGIMSPEEYMDLLIKGIKNMLFPLFMVILAYFFAAACDVIGFMDYAIGLGLRFTTPATLPLVVFITFGITEFIMGISWGMYVIAMPIVIPLAFAMDANPFIAVGAVCSAGVWGSHICFYSDATILTSAACGCDNFRHAITQVPFGMLAMVLSLIGFFTVGMLGI